MILVDVVWLEAHPATSQILASGMFAAGMCAVALATIITSLAKR